MKHNPQKAEPRRGGRPSRDQAGKIEEKILNAAAALFFSEGYGFVSIEEIVRRAQISKRTFYARYDNKAAIFRAVVMRVIAKLKPPNNEGEAIFKNPDMDAEAILRKMAPLVLRLTLTRDAVNLYRLVTSESGRFPELAHIIYEHGGREHLIQLVAELLQRDASKRGLSFARPAVAAEQFVFLLIGVPQRRAIGMGIPLRPDEYDGWANDAVTLFLNGCWSLSKP